MEPLPFDQMCYLSCKKNCFAYSIKNFLTHV
jgi:hypothetical protein